MKTVLHCDDFGKDLEREGTKHESIFEHINEMSIH